LRHVDDGGGEVAFAGLLGGALGEIFSGAGLRAEKNRERHERVGGGTAGALRRGIDRAAREQAGEVTVEPRALLGGERRGFGNDGDGGRVHESSS